MIHDRTRGLQRLTALAIGCLAPMVLALVGCSPPARNAAPTFAPPPTQAAPAGSTITVERGSIAQTVQSRGRVVAEREARLVFPLEGRLAAVHVVPGDEVEQGAPLAELYAPQIEEQAAQAQLDLESAEMDLKLLELEQEDLEAVASPPEVMAVLVDLKRAEAKMEQAEDDYRFALQASEPPTITRPLSRTATVREYEYWLASARYAEAKRSLAVEQAVKELEIEQARRKVERARARSSSASDRLSSTKLVAPFSGVIVSIDKAVGDQVGSYEPIGVIADPSQLHVVATVPNEDLSQIAVGRPVTVQLDAHPNEEYAGTVLRIASQPVILQGQTAYEVTVSFDQGQDVPATIRMGASVTIGGESREDVLVVPARAIITIGDRSYVEVVRDDGQVERVEIETGLSSGEETEVTAGLEEGQEIQLP